MLYFLAYSIAYEPAGAVMIRFGHSEKAFSSILVTLSGIVIDARLEQPLKVR